MNKYYFNQNSQNVPLVKTKYRRIATAIPHPESKEMLRDLTKYEARSMHGQLPVIWDRADNFQVFDKHGNCWIDFTSTIFVTSTGHSNPHIIEAIQQQLKHKLIHTYTFVQESRVKFLKKLIGMVPEYLEKAFLLSSGTEAVECAVKLMRMHGQRTKSSKIGVISFKGSMHGRTMAMEMLKGDLSSQSWIGYKDPHMYHLPFPFPWNKKDDAMEGCDWVAQFKRDIEQLKRDGVDFTNVCGFIIESYQGWGALLYHKAYIKALEYFARDHDILISFDEIQGGFGRTGKLFAYQHYDVKPDLICLGKALSGSLPLSAVVGKSDILDLPEIGSMSSTHSANPLCCAAALANLEVIESENLVEESRRKGEILHSRLSELKRKFPKRIFYIGGKGLLAGIIIIDPVNKKPDSAFASKVCERAMQKGLLLVHTARESIKIGPPLTICDEALMEGLDVLEESFEEIDKEQTE